MNSFFHSLADFEGRGASGESAGPEIQKSAAPPAPPRGRIGGARSEGPRATSPSPSTAPAARTLSPAPPPSRGRAKYSLLEDRITRSIKALLPSLGLQPEEIRLRKERLKEPGGAWKVELTLIDSGRASKKIIKSLSGADSIVFRVAPAENDTLRVECVLHKSQARVRMGKATAQAGSDLDEAFKTSVKYLIEGLIR